MLYPRWTMVILCLLFLQISGSIGLAAENEGITKEEYEVYSAILSDLKEAEPAATKFVIKENTAVFQKLDENTVQYIEEQLSLAPGAGAQLKLERPIIEDYNKKNEAPSKLENKFQVLQYILFLEDKISDEIFSFTGEDDGWDRFYKIFPGAPGIFEFSRVGLNGDRTKAFLYFGNQRHWTAGAGYYLILQKDKVSGKWQTVGRVMAYIS